MKTGTLRVRSVKMKGGGEVRVFRNAINDGMRDQYVRQSSMILDRTNGITAFAIIVWDFAGEAHTAVRSIGRPVPSAILPEVAKDVLRTHIIRDLCEYDRLGPPLDRGA